MEDDPAAPSATPAAGNGVTDPPRGGEGDPPMLTEKEFQSALAIVLGHEGGFVDNPKDPGGATNFGVTQKTLAAWRGVPVDQADVRTITPAEVQAIYRQHYWLASGAPALPYPLAVAHFDTAVNMGVAEAGKILARSGVDVATYLANRKAVYQQIVAARPESATFLAGWLKRVDQLAQQIKPVVAFGALALLVLGALYWWWQRRSGA